MSSRAIRVVALLAVTSMAGAVVFAADPWNTGSLWNRASPSGSIQGSPRSVLSPMGSVGAVASPQAVPQVTVGVIPPDKSVPLAKPSPLSVTALGIGLKGNVSAGARIVTMKCAGCHGQDGSGHGYELDQIGGQPPIPWTDKAQMSQITDQQIASKIASSGQQENPDARMPVIRGLSTQDLSDVVAYIRSLAAY